MVYARTMCPKQMPLKFGEIYRSEPRPKQWIANVQSIQGRKFTATGIT